MYGILAYQLDMSDVMRQRVESLLCSTSRSSEGSAGAQMRSYSLWIFSGISESDMSRRMT